MPRLAERMGRIRPFYVMDILARARSMEAAGREIIHMEVGEPDFSSPEPIVRAGIEALKAGKTHYTPALGLPELREALAGYYADHFGVDISSRRVALTPGSSGALQLVMNVLVNPGERVLLTDPGYPCNRHFVELTGGRPVALPVTGENNYLPTLQQLEQSWSKDTVALMLASPANPTGAVISRQQVSGILDFVRTRGGLLIIDEIYQGLTYEGEPFSCLELGDDLLVINSFSKYFGMTGWRLGWAVAPEWMQDAVDRLAQNIFLAAPTMAQYAALAAFSKESLAIVESRRDTFRQRRDFLLPALESLGFRFTGKPQGAFYLYADVSGVTDDSFSFCDRLLSEAGVAVTPGIDFGEYRANTHVRFAYTQPMERLQSGVERIAEYIAQPDNP